MLNTKNYVIILFSIFLLFLIVSGMLFTVLKATGDEPVMNNGIIWCQVKKDNFMIVGGETGKEFPLDTIRISIQDRSEYFKYYAMDKYQVTTKNSNIICEAIYRLKTETTGNLLLLNVTLILPAEKCYVIVFIKIKNIGDKTCVLDNIPSHIHDGICIAKVRVKQPYKAYLNNYGTIEFSSVGLWEVFTPSKNEPFMTLYDKDGNAVTIGLISWDTEPIQFVTNGIPRDTIDFQVKEAILAPNQEISYVLAIAFHTGNEKQGRMLYEDAMNWLVSVSRYLCSGSDLGEVFVLPFPHQFLSIPADTYVKIYVLLNLKHADIVVNKEAKVTIGEKTMLTINITNPSRVEFNITIRLPYGIHKMWINFTDYGFSYSLGDIIAYRSSGFNITKDAYHFTNWKFLLEDYIDFLEWLSKEYNYSSIIFMPIYPIAVWDGHCFGMAYTSSSYFTNALRKPVEIDVYALSREDAQLLIDLFQAAQLYIRKEYGEQLNISEAFERIKGLIDMGTPPVVGFWRHAVTVMGYYDGEEGRYLIVYDSSPNRIHVWTVTDEYVENIYGRYESLEVLVPVNMSTHEVIDGFIQYVYSHFIGLTIHSPVDIIVESADGGTLKIINSEIIENTINGSYASAETILLPSNSDYTVKIIGKEEYKVNINLILLADNELMVGKYENISIKEGSKLTLEIRKNETPKIMNVDVNGDGTIDSAIEPAIKTSSPNVEITQPAIGTTIEKDTIIIEWKIELGLYPITKAEIRLDNGPWIDVTNRTNYRLTGLKDGKHTVTLRVKDRMGNTAEDSIIFTVKLPTPSEHLIAAAFIIAAALIVTVIIVARRRQKIEIVVGNNSFLRVDGDPS